MSNQPIYDVLAMRRYLRKMANLPKRRNRNSKTWMDIRPGSKVTLFKTGGIGKHGREFTKVTGRAVMFGPGGWVINIGGPHGTPAICSEENFISTT